MRPRIMDDAPSNGPRAKPWIMGIHAYVPGIARSDDGRELIKLSANENPLGTSKAALAARTNAPAPSKYPDPDATKLRQAIGALHNIDPARIICGTGSDELLNLAAQGFAGPGDEVLFSRFSFSVYDIAARRCGATPIEAADNDYAADVDALLAAVSRRTRVVYLANPNNPTGTYLPADEVARLHAGLPANILLVIDQAYAEYLGEGENDGGLELAQRSENVLVTRTFSKIYGLAGERVGWATGAPHLIDTLNRIRGPFNVTLAGQASAIAALADQQFVRESRDHNALQLARFSNAIGAMGNHGLRAIPSRANFQLVLFEGETSAKSALNSLAQGGYAVRHMPNQGLAHALRITIGTAQDMDNIIAILKKLLGENA